MTAAIVARVLGMWSRTPVSGAQLQRRADKAGNEDRSRPAHQVRWHVDVHGHRHRISSPLNAGPRLQRHCGCGSRAAIEQKQGMS